MDSMGSIVPHDTVVMLYKLHTQHTGQQDGSGKQQCLKILFNFVLNNNKENYDDDDDEDETVRTSQSVVANGSN